MEVKKERKLFSAFYWQKWYIFIIFEKQFQPVLCWKPVYDSSRHFGDLKPVYDKTVYSGVYTTHCLELPVLPNGAIDDTSVWFWVIAWRRTGGQPLSEPMLIHSPGPVFWRMYVAPGEMIQLARFTKSVWRCPRHCVIADHWERDTQTLVIRSFHQSTNEVKQICCGCV